MHRQLELLAVPRNGTRPRLVERPGLRLRHWPGWLAAAATIRAELLREVPWQQEQITLWGKTHLLPRLTCWMADPGCAYTYSGLRHSPTPWTVGVSRLRAMVEAEAGCRFNSLLLNLYRDGSDRMGWHADDEPELDPQAPIASLSLGATRSFQLRPRRTSPGERQRLSLELGDGDLLLMDPPTQQHWLHQLPARRRVLEPRLNLTFRVVRREPRPRD
jgi:alkylated DNA repair dioxygenase AlkB